MIKKIIFAVLIILCLVTSVSAYKSISQGENVYLNETVDISQVMGWGYGIAYYGNSGDAPTYIIEPKNVYTLYIDPKIFSSRTGTWYQWEGNISSSSKGYDVAFVVIGRERNIINTTNISIDLENVSSVGVHYEVPSKHIADYLVARGDPLDIKLMRTANVWIFGENDMICNKRTVGGYARFNREEINSLVPGTYSLLIQYPGDNAEFNAVYDGKNSTINTLATHLEGWNIYSTSVKGFSPLNILDTLKTEINKTDDTYELFTLSVAHPYISIISRDNVDSSIVTDKGTIIVTGYTNVAEGTVLNFSVDDVNFKNTRVKPFTSILAKATDNPGDMRYFVAYIPFYYSDLTVGAHTITGTTAIGGAITVDFYVYSLPEGSERPDTSTKYINGSEFIPQPTPQIIKVVETQVVEKKVEVVRTVQVVQTPDYQYLEKMYTKSKYDMIFKAAGIGGIIIFGLYFISVIWRAYIMKEGEK